MIKEYPDAWKEVLAVGTNREQINLVAPKVVKTFHNCSRYQVWLNIPNRFQRDPSSSVHPVMYDFAAGRGQRSAHSQFESPTALLE
jgi:hypothetical protein